MEAQTWGLAYVDLHPLTHRPDEVQPLCTQLGQSLRARLGEAMQPSLGWDSGKFTARAAATQTKPGRLRLVAKGDEARFLGPLPVHLLPLPPLPLQHLHWLGIRTLGQFARLPAVGVWQRFGKAGKVAQQWAKGRDTRPVRNTLSAIPDAVTVECEPPTASSPQVLAALLAALRPRLKALAKELAGVRRLRLELRFLEGSDRTLDLTFVEPVGDGPRLRWALDHQLQALAWPGELVSLRVLLLEVGELTVRQLSFFGQDEDVSDGMAELAQRLSGYGPVLFRSRVVDGTHPLPERRSALQVLAP